MSIQLWKISATQQQIDRLDRPAKVAEFILREVSKGDSDTSLNMGKCWAGVLFTLQAAVPASDAEYAILGQHELAGEFDYGPPRCESPIEVRRSCRLLDSVSAARFSEAIDLDALGDQDVYPQIWDEGDSAVADLNDGYQALQRFVQKCADRELGIISVLL